MIRRLVVSIAIIQSMEKGVIKMGGSRETLCANCIHVEVCKYKKDYLAAVEEIQKVFETTSCHKEPIFTFKDPGCRLYHNQSPYIKNSLLEIDTKER